MDLGRGAGTALEHQILANSATEWVVRGLVEGVIDLAADFCLEACADDGSMGA
jgi:hypothetical protein